MCFLFPSPSHSSYYNFKNFNCMSIYQNALQVSHPDAVKILSSQEGQVRLEVVYVSADDEDGEDDDEDAYDFK